MADTFDPYEQWFHIPPGEQPPNHYRLLGLATYEADPSLIERAVAARVEFLHDVSAGARRRESQRLLNEVAAARLCLLDPVKKSRYDAELMTGVRAPEDLEYEDVRIETDAPKTAKTVAKSRRLPIGKGRDKKKNAGKWMIWIIAGSTIVLGFSFVGLFMLISSTTSKNDSEAQEAPPPLSPREEYQLILAKQREEAQKQRERNAAFSAMANEEGSANTEEKAAAPKPEARPK